MMQSQQPIITPTFAELPPEEETISSSNNYINTTTTATGTATAAAAPSTTASSTNENSNAPSAPDPNNTIANLSSPWEFDDLQLKCTSCPSEFNPINRKHHCRFCGKIFCGSCTNQRCLIPPTQIVLVPKGGKKVKPNANVPISFSPDEDPDRMLTYVDDSNQVLYGKGLEERFTLARQPLRVCRSCFANLMPLQPELRHSNSNAMRYNHIDPTDARRFLNSPLAFTLGHEVRKAAYTLNNLLPTPKRQGIVTPVTSTLYDGYPDPDLQHCKEACSTLSPNMGDLDGVRIPARLLEEAKGVATMTVIKGGFGFVGGEIGTGLVVARLANGTWSAPSAIGTGGVSWGALIGAQVSDHVFLLMTDGAVEMLFSHNGSINLGADVGVALGPLGRSLEGNVGASQGSIAPIYSYSLSKGLYAGLSLDGKVIVTRHDVNEKFYGRQVTPSEMLSGLIPTPPAAQPLYDALTRCHVYAGGGARRGGGGGSGSGQSTTGSAGTNLQPTNSNMSPEYNMEYGEFHRGQMMAEGFPAPMSIPATNSMLQPPAANDQHSYVSGLTTETGFTID